MAAQIGGLPPRDRAPDHWPVSLDVGHHTQRAIEGAAACDGNPVEAHLQRVLLTDALRRHAGWSAQRTGLAA